MRFDTYAEAETRVAALEAERDKLEAIIAELREQLLALQAILESDE